MRMFLHVLVNGFGIWLIAYLLPGIHYQGGFLYLLLTGLVIGLLNLLVKPIVTLLSLPFIILTLGLFYLAINGFLLWLAAALLSGLTVDGCGTAILGGLVMAIYNLLARELLFGHR
jgi:putative membrane protein